MIIDKDLLKQSQRELYWNKGFKEGFQKGKLEQKKEELELLVKINGLWFDDEEKGMINIIQKRIKQLQKEIGEEKQDENS